MNFKGIAREKLLGSYSTIIGAILLMQLIFFFVSYITDRVVDDTTATGLVIYIAIAVIVGLIGAVFTVGELTIYMKLACGDNISMWDIFSGFTGHPDKAIIIQFLIAVRCLVFMLPLIGVIAYTIVAGGGLSISEAGVISLGKDTEFVANPFFVLTTVICILIGLAGYVYVRIRYAQAFYLMIDHPEYEAARLLTESTDMMKGHMWEYLYINLSFVPIALLGILSLGVGFMYIQPYRGMTLTEFYFALASGKLSRGRNIDVVIKD